jgi:C4-dicarboxylate transporter DctQ subunit
MRRFSKVFVFIINHIEELIITVCMFGITLLTFFSAMSRYLFNLPVSGADEIASFLFLWAALFGAAAAFKYNKHGGVPLLADLLSNGARRIADLLVLATTAAFFLFLSYYTWQYLVQSYHVGQTSPATGVPSWVINAGTFAAIFLCGVRCIVAILRDLANLPRYEEAPGEPLPLIDNAAKQP